MRHLLCEACGQEYTLVAGEGLALAANPKTGDPAEYERVVWGTANMPRPEQRVMYINDEPFPVEPQDEYTCDLCGASIRPGDRCCTQTVWLEGDERIPSWEHEFIAAEKVVRE